MSSRLSSNCVFFVNVELVCVNFDVDVDVDVDVVRSSLLLKLLPLPPLFLPSRIVSFTNECVLVVLLFSAYYYYYYSFDEDILLLHYNCHLFFARGCCLLIVVVVVLFCLPNLSSFPFSLHYKPSPPVVSVLNDSSSIASHRITSPTSHHITSHHIASHRIASHLQK